MYLFQGRVREPGLLCSCTMLSKPVLSTQLLRLCPLTLVLVLRVPAGPFRMTRLLHLRPRRWRLSQSLRLWRSHRSLSGRFLVHLVPRLRLCRLPMLHHRLRLV